MNLIENILNSYHTRKVVNDCFEIEKKNPLYKPGNWKMTKKIKNCEFLKIFRFFQYFWEAFFSIFLRQVLNKHLVGVKKSLPGLKNSPQNCGKSDTYKVFSTCSMSWFHDKNYLILLIFNIFCIVCSDSNIFNFWNGLLLLWNSKNLI